MKRYWMTLLFSLLAIGGISVYYSMGSVDHLPDFKLEALEGDPDELGAVSLTGTYGGRMKSEVVEVTAAGSRYQDRNTNVRNQLLGRDKWFSRSMMFDSFIGERRNVTRGKKYDLQAYINEDWFIYAKWADFRGDSSDQGGTMQITVYDRKADKERQFEVDVRVFPGAIADVQKLGNELHVVINNYLSYYPSAAIYDLVIDLSSEKWDRTDKLAGKNELSGKIFTRNSIYLNEDLSESSSAFMLVNEAKESIISGSIGSSFESERLSEHLYAYSLLTGKKEEIPVFYTLSKSFDSEDNRFKTSLYGDTYSLVKYSVQSAVVSQYNLSTKEDRREYLKLTPEQFGAVKIGDAVLGNNKIYLLLLTKSAPLVAVVDLQDTTILYLGQVAYVNPEVAETEKIEYLRLGNIYVKRQ